MDRESRIILTVNGVPQKFMPSHSHRALSTVLRSAAQFWHRQPQHTAFEFGGKSRRVHAHWKADCQHTFILRFGYLAGRY
jgi:hypothetical protein